MNIDIDIDAEVQLIEMAHKDKDFYRHDEIYKWPEWVRESAVKFMIKKLCEREWKNHEDNVEIKKLCNIEGCTCRVLHGHATGYAKHSAAVTGLSEVA